MENQDLHHHECTHCACRNPILEVLEEDLFNPKNFAELSALKTAHTKKSKPRALMVRGGTIRPMTNGSVEPVDAIGFADGVVVVTGTEKEVKKFMEHHHPKFKDRVLEPGHTLLPGLIEPHVHIVPTALMMSWVDLGRFDGQKLLKDYGLGLLRERITQNAASMKKNEWLLGNGLDPSLMPFEIGHELLKIDATLLDSITDKVPILILSASMHTLYLNTSALEKVYNKNKGTPAFHKYHNFEKYKKETQGQLQDAEMYPALQTIPKPQILSMFIKCFDNLTTLFKTAGERGVTFLYDAGMTKGLKKVLDAYLLANSSVLRIGAAQVCHTAKEARKLDHYKRHEIYEDVYIGSIKVVSDGSNQGLTGYQSEEYKCDPKENYGLFNFGKHKKPTDPPHDYKELIKTVVADRGWPLMVHANGDLAVKFIIEVYDEYIPKDQDREKIRHRIEHCSLATKKEFTKMNEMGVSPSFLIGHVGYWGHAFKKVIFKEKSEMLDLCKTALDEGMRITLHSDNMVSPLGPLRMMEQAITRIMEADPELNVLNQHECITAEQALTAITYDAAWQCHADHWTGSLIPGHFADFVILKHDPLKIKEPYMKMRDIHVLETWVDGHKVYHRE
ncbi:MAG TPA: amidohydrolase [Arachidicoccus sp.]|nr:amidohydrolase [Arachidicoccus sp.]